MTNWFIQDGKVLTDNGKIRGCCCGEPCTSWSPYGFGWNVLNGFKRSGDNCPSGTLHFRILNRTGGDRTWTYCGNNLSVPKTIGDDYDDYSVVIPEGCNLLAAPIINFPTIYRYWLDSWSWVED